MKGEKEERTGEGQGNTPKKRKRGKGNTRHPRITIGQGGKKKLTVKRSLVEVKTSQPLKRGLKCGKNALNPSCLGKRGRTLLKKKLKMGGGRACNKKRRGTGGGGEGDIRRPIHSTRTHYNGWGKLGTGKDKKLCRKRKETAQKKGEEGRAST